MLTLPPQNKKLWRHWLWRLLEKLLKGAFEHDKFLVLANLEPEPFFNENFGSGSDYSKIWRLPDPAPQRWFIQYPTKYLLLCFYIKKSQQFFCTSQKCLPTISIYIRIHFVHHNFCCISIYHPLSYPFRSLRFGKVSILQSNF